MFRKTLPLLLFALFAVGCGGGSKVECEVTLDGKAVDGATVVFTPVGAKGKPSSGVTDSSGKVTLSGPDGKGKVPSGEYTVTITKTKKLADGSSMKPRSPEYLEFMKKRAEKQGGTGEPEHLLPAKYADPAKSPLTAKVPSSSYKFELKK